MGVIHSIVKRQKPYIELLEVIDQLHDGYVKSGFPDLGDVGKATRKGSRHKPYEDISEVARVAVWNEFGTTNGIPARPFFRNAIDGNREKIFDMAARFANLAMIGKSTVAEAFERLGLFMQSTIRSSIRNGSWQANSPKTEKKKGSTKPLIDTGQMINSVTFIKFMGKHAGKGVPEVVS
jgi:hypothetical protein